jgi:putative FmdB family regulatory protein
MPTYDYECSGCGHHFEAFHSISAEPLSDCPECGGSVRRMIGGGAGFLFKGSGFYETDSRSSDYKKAAASDKPAEAAPKKVEKSASNKDAKKAK